MPRVHRVASLLKRWLLGTHQGGVQQHHVDAYLDEFVFRFNRRTSRDRGKLGAAAQRISLAKSAKRSSLWLTGISWLL